MSMTMEQVVTQFQQELFTTRLNLLGFMVVLMMKSFNLEVGGSEGHCEKWK